MEQSAAPRSSRYYEQLGRSCDDIVRCEACGRLLVMVEITTRGACRCGHRRVKEVTGLSVWEYLKIRLGITRFAHRQAFLAEFRRG
jgi:hypothetical protein